MYEKERIGLIIKFIAVAVSPKQAPRVSHPFSENRKKISNSVDNKVLIATFIHFVATGQKV
jgi:hypothetical protein